MPKARYKLVRLKQSVAGWASSQRASTDALNALGVWSHAVAGRSFTEVSDDDNSLIVDLTWSEADVDAGASLEGACRRAGVERFHIASSAA